MKLTKAQRNEIKLKFGGKCSYCGCDLPEKGWHVDHAEPVIRKSEWQSTGTFTGKFVNTGEAFRPENHSFENLMPACAPCNLYKSSMNIEGLRYEIALQVERARKSSLNFRLAEKFGLVTVTEAPIVFHFERYAGRAALAQGGRNNG